MVKEIHDKNLREWDFEISPAMIIHIQLQKHGEVDDNLKVVANTPACKQCANYLQGEMIKKYIDEKMGKKVEKKKEEEK